MIKVFFLLKQYTYCCLYCSPKKCEPQYAYKRYAYKRYAYKRYAYKEKCVPVYIKLFALQRLTTVDTTVDT